MGLVAGHVRQRGSKWQAIASYRDGTGKLVQLSATRASKAEANKALVDLLRRAQNGDRPTAGGTLNDLIDAWWEVNAKKWSEDTRRVRRSILDNHVRGSIGKMKLKALGVYEFEKWFSGLEVEASGIYRILHAALEVGVKWGWLAKNPIDGAKPKEPKKYRFTPPTVEEMQKLFAAAREEDEWFEVFLRYALATGARRADLCATKWEYIDWTSGLVLIEGSKTDNEHMVTLGKGMVERLGAHRARLLRAMDDRVMLGPYVFSSHPTHQTPLSGYTADHKLARVRERVGMTIKLHDLRRTNGTWLSGEGIPVATVAYRLGHARTSITHDLYTHRVPTDDARAAEAIDRLLG